MTDTAIDYKLQVSIKHGPGQSCMTNVRAQTAQELEDLLSDLVGRGPDIAAACEALGAVQTIAQGIPGTTVINSPAQTSSNAAQACPHGAMRWVEKPEYAGHFCPAQREDPSRCKPRYVRKG